jgi:hypothetical protein
MTKKKNNKKLYLIIFLSIFVFILLVYLFSNLVDYYSVLDRQEILTKVIVNDSFGIDLNQSALTFGMITQGASSTRGLVVKNTYSHNVKVQIHAIGDIMPLLKISENDFILIPGEEKEVEFTTVAKDIDNGIYSGKIIILIKNPVIK